MAKYENPKLILFDLGGVLIEVRTETLRNFCSAGLNDAAIWEIWLTCDTVHEYESGKISEHEFALGVFKHFNSNMTAQAFLDSFAAWPVGFFPGAVDQLKRLKAKYRLAYLSNSNPVHYARFQEEWNLNTYFDDHFASHLMGLAKPDPKIFLAVLAAVPFKPSEILFIDDNRLNVEAAQALGIRSQIVRGGSELHRVLDLF